MSELPCCRLCESKAQTLYILYSQNHVICSNTRCKFGNEEFSFTEQEWIKLMHVPEKRKIPQSHFGYAEGWNDCVDAMSKGE